MEREYEVVLVEQPEGGFTVSVPELPDVVTEGEIKEKLWRWPKTPSKAISKP